MKTIISRTLAGLLIGTVANAGVNFDLRFDDEAVNFNKTHKDAGSKDYYQMKLKTLRLDYTTKFDDSMSAKIRLNLNKDEGTTASPDGLGLQGDAVELAHFKHILTEGLTLTLGKFATDVAGWENQTTSPDRYIDSRYLSSTAKSLRYLSGAMISYAMGDHNIDLQVTNAPTDASVADQNRGVVGIVYKGKFMDGTLKPLVSHHTFSPQANGVDPKAAYAFTTVGLRFETEDFLIDLDDDMGSLKGKTAADKTDTVNTIAAGFGYKLDSITPRFKFDTTKETSINASNVKSEKTYTNMALVAEYKPVKENNVRYHAGFVQASEKAATGDAKVTTTYLVGVRIGGDLLK